MCLKFSLLIVYILTLSVNCIGQNVNTYIECKDMFIIEDLPPKYKESIFNYEEGFFKTYYWLNGDVFDMHCGSMNDNTYLRDTLNYQILDTIDLKDRTLYSGIEKKSKRTFGVMKMKGYRLTISFISSACNRNVFMNILKIRKQETNTE